jgi:hypothetical protein
LYKLAESGGVIDDGGLRNSEMIIVLRMKDNIRAGVVEE